MRLFLVLSILFALPTNTGQAPQRHERVSLEVGSITVWLGMTKEEATKRFSNAGYEVTVAGDQLLMRKGSDGRVVWFKDGRLFLPTKNGTQVTKVTSSMPSWEHLGLWRERLGTSRVGLFILQFHRRIRRAIGYSYPAVNGLC